MEAFQQVARHFSVFSCSLGTWLAVFIQARLQLLAGPTLAPARLSRHFWGIVCLDKEALGLRRWLAPVLEAPALGARASACGPLTLWGLHVSGRKNPRL